MIIETANKVDLTEVFYVKSDGFNLGRIPFEELEKSYNVAEMSVSYFISQYDVIETEYPVVIICSNNFSEVIYILESLKKPGLLLDTRVILYSENNDVLGLQIVDSFDIQAIIPCGFDMEYLEKKLESALFSYKTLRSSHNIKEFYLDNKFYDVFEWFESSRWEWSDVEDGTKIDRNLVTDQDIKLLKEGAIVEFTTLPGAHNFMNEWASEFGFSTWALQWGAEESRHALVQAKYLRELGVEIRSKHALFTRKPYDVGDNPAATLMMNVISEYRAANYYNRRSQITQEPKLKKIWRLLSKDEARHARAFYAFCKEYSDDKEENMLAALKMAYVWLIDADYGVKHPAGLFFPHAESPASIKLIENEVGTDTHDRGDDFVYRALQKLTGNEGIIDTATLKKEIRSRV